MSSIEFNGKKFTIIETGYSAFAIEELTGNKNLYNRTVLVKNGCAIFDSKEELLQEIAKNNVRIQRN